MKKHPVLCEYGLILLNPVAYFIALYLWALATLLLAIKLSLLAIGIMIPVGIGLVILLVNLATHTIRSRKRWLQSLPIQYVLFLIVMVVQFNPFDTPLTLGAVTEVLLSTLILAAIALIIQAIGPVIAWVKTRANRKW